MTKENLILLYNLREQFPFTDLVHPDISADWDIPETIELLKDGLTSIGYNVDTIPYSSKQVLKSLNSKTMVFNICEMSGGSYREALIPSLLETFEIPYVFSQPDVMLKTLDKNICNFLVKQMGIKVPEWHYLTTEVQINELQKLSSYPYIVKLSHEGSGIGISNESIVYDYKGLCERVEFMFATYKRPILIQKFISGIETTIGIAGSTTNPIVFQLVEIELLGSSVYGIFEKENSHTKAKYSSYKNTKIENQVSQICKEIYYHLNCRDASRLDFIIENKTMTPYFIEINTLPHLHPGIGDFCRSASMANFSYESLLKMIMESAKQRYNL